LFLKHNFIISSIFCIEVERVRSDGHRLEGGLHRGGAAGRNHLQDPTLADRVQDHGRLPERVATFMVRT
jgi:hypothetical protein